MCRRARIGHSGASTGALRAPTSAATRPCLGKLEKLQFCLGNAVAPLAVPSYPFVSSGSAYFIKPLKPRKAKLRSPAATKRMGVPSKLLGTFAVLSLFLTPDMMTMLSRNPAAEPSA